MGENGPVPTLIVAVVALCMAVMALLLAGRTRAELLALRRRVAAGGPEGIMSPMPADPGSSRSPEADLPGLRNVAVVRYDAFGDLGGRLSYSLAVLDDQANGFVLTAIHGRAETRQYVKAVMGGTGDTPLSPEESQAVTGAMSVPGSERR